MSKRPRVATVTRGDVDPAIFRRFIAAACKRLGIEATAYGRHNLPVLSGFAAMNVRRFAAFADKQGWGESAGRGTFSLQRDLGNGLARAPHRPQPRQA